MARMRTAILISGRGSNMTALLEAARQPAYPAQIVLVMSNRPDAAGLARAAEAGFATAVVDHKAYPDRASFEAAMQTELDRHGVELVCLAGFMRVLTPWFIERWTGRLLNIHPSLLPAFRGLHTHERALEEGVKLHGCTVHFVVPELDAGPIVAQGAVPVLAGDTPDSLGGRVLAVEHRLYPLAVALVASGRARLVDGRVLEHDVAGPSGILVNPSPDIGEPAA
ncbi:phosphoribosylglycinamide formyltransferase [Alsobacter sp. SYSU M60028]|uniref:Phosphoribosylglycinamide formyltransferase n=1 Tax=Alsobacter ponti TaxID=2962936 RepID=A0ABT1LCZ0_9HYPH|nr:phosphoribosylglycinamide formyltransferase [Alsobacter ponti]MCP8939370.1 phosphoribosylglycinamide formyltransferase [Alsobacter ponti]